MRTLWVLRIMSAYLRHTACMTTTAELQFSQRSKENYTSFNKKLSPLAFASGYVFRISFQITLCKGLRSVFFDDLSELSFQTLTDF